MLVAVCMLPPYSPLEQILLKIVPRGFQTPFLKAPTRAFIQVREESSEVLQGGSWWSDWARGITLPRL